MRISSTHTNSSSPPSPSHPLTQPTVLLSPPHPVSTGAVVVTATDYRLKHSCEVTDPAHYGTLRQTSSLHPACSSSTIQLLPQPSLEDLYTHPPSLHSFLLKVSRHTNTMVVVDAARLSSSLSHSEWRYLHYISTIS